MKALKIVAFLAALGAIAAILAVRGRGPAPVKATASEQARQDQAAPLPETEKETPPRSEAAPEIVFLEEAASSQSPDRPRPTAQRMPAVNGTRRVVNARPITTKEQGEFVSPRWSPDGLELLVSRPGFIGLYTVGAHGGEITQLTNKEGIGFGADWTENGEIATRTNDGQTQKLNPDGSPADSLEVEADASRVGTFTKDDTVFYRPAPGEAPVPLTSGEDRYYGGVVSPDGKYIAYNGLHTGVYVQPLDGSAPPVSLGHGVSPRWLPDSSGVVYNVTADDGHNLIAGDLYLATTDGQNVSNLTQTENTVELNPAVSPDGTKVAYEADGVVYVGELQ